jgi:hypothetical protein
MSDAMWRNDHRRRGLVVASIVSRRAMLRFLLFSRGFLDHDAIAFSHRARNGPSPVGEGEKRGGAEYGDGGNNQRRS